MTGIRRVSDLGTRGAVNIVDGSIQTADIASNVITQAKIDTNIPLSGMRNMLINGSFDIWQRWVATSIDVGSGVTAYTADRWFLSPVGATMGAIRTTNIRANSNSIYVYEITPNGVGGSTCRLGQRIEAANVSRLRGTVTFSAWIYNNTGAAITPNLLLGTPSASDNFTSVTNRLTQALQSCPNATWTQVSHTVDISGYTNIANGLQVELETSNHTTYGKIVRVSEVQLERGSQITPFEHRPPALESLMCKRYFWRCVDPAAVGVNDANIRSTRTLIPFHTEMRAAPTSVVSGTLNFWNGSSTGTGTGLIGTFNTRNHGQLDFNGGVGAHTGVVTLYTTGGSQYIDFLAEL